MKKKVQVVVFRKLGDITQVLLLKTNSERGGFWQNVTGSVDGKEKFKEAALRELQEETGYKAKSQELIFTELVLSFRNPRNKKVKEKVFAIKTEGQWQVLMDRREHQDFQWQNIDQIDRNHFGFFSNWLAFLAGQEKCLKN